jgi:hypothetical protein
MPPVRGIRTAREEDRSLGTGRRPIPRDLIDRCRLGDSGGLGGDLQFQLRVRASVLSE